MDIDNSYIYSLGESSIRLYESGMVTICRSMSGQKKPGNKGKAGKELAKRKKSFELNPKKIRLIKNSTVRQSLMKKNNLIFFTLTFPGQVDQNFANNCFSKFVENLSLNFKLYSYVSVKENHKSGNPHFHCIMDIPYINFSTLNRSWNSTFRTKFKFSSNALTTGKQKIVRNVEQAAKYITKYISKVKEPEIKPENLIKLSWRELLQLEKDFQAYNELISTRIYFISDNVLSSPARISESTLEYLLHLNKYTLKRFESDEYIVYLFKDFYCLPEEFVFKPPPKPEKKKLKIDAIQCNFSF